MTHAQITEYRRKGWTFRVDEYDNHHNGNPEVDLYAKSPRTREEFCIGERRWEDVTEGRLIERELRWFTHQRYKDNEWGIENAARAALHEQPNAKQITVTIPLE